MSAEDPGSGSRPSGESIFLSAWWRYVTSGAALCFVMAGFGGIGAGESPTEMAVFATLGVISSVLVVRAFRMGMKIDDNGVVVRNLTRSRRIYWRDIGNAECELVGSSYLDIWAPCLILRDGTRVLAEGLRRFSVRSDDLPPRPVVKYVETIAAMLPRGTDVDPGIDLAK